MSSGAGGEVGVVIIAAPAAAVVIAVGLAWGVGKCAVGVAKGAYLLGRAANEAIEAHEAGRALAARQLELERQRWAAYQRTLTAFMSACESAGIEPEGLVPGPYPTPSAEVDVLQQALAEMATATAGLRREAARHAAAAKVAALTAAVAHQASSVAVSAADAIARSTAELKQGQLTRDAMAQSARDAAVAAAKAQARRKQDALSRDRITAALAELPADVDDETAARVAFWTTQELSGARLTQAAVDLEAVCGRARDRAALQAERDTTAGAVVAALAGCGTAAAAEIVARAEQYLRGEQAWDARLLDQAKAEIAHVQSEFEDLWAAAALADCLNAMGYELGPDFQVDLLHGGAYAARPEWSSHGVQVSLDPRTDRFTSEVTRQGSPGQTATQVESAEDVAVATQYCSDLDKVVKCVATKGVSLAISHRDEPGDKELVRDDVRGAMTGRRRRVPVGKVKDRVMERRPDE